MARISALLPDPTAQARLKEAVSPPPGNRRARNVAFFDRWCDVDTASLGELYHMVVFDPYAGGEMDASACEAFHRRFPSVALLPYGRFGADSIPDILRLADAGVRRVVRFGRDDAPAPFRRTLDAAVAEACTERIAGELSDLMTPELNGLLQLAATGGGPLRPDAAARGHFCHPKTLRERLRASGLPPTNKAIAWVRLLHAACLLEDPGRSVAAVARALGYPSAAALDKQMRRYTGLAPRAVADGYGLGRLAEQFRHRMREGRWSVTASATA